MFVYWLETGVVVFYSVLKVVTVPSGVLRRVHELSLHDDPGARAVAAGPRLLPVRGHPRAVPPNVERESVDRARNVSHVVRCRFRYDVAGVEHVTTYWTHSTQDRETVAEMRRWVAQHRSGSVQPIRYDPRAPDRVSLGELGEAIDPPLVGQTLTAAGGFAGVGALLLVLARWRARRAVGHRPVA
jgi:hypothetical protein